MEKKWKEKENNWALRHVQRSVAWILSLQHGRLNLNHTQLRANQLNNWVLINWISVSSYASHILVRPGSYHLLSYHLARTTTRTSSAKQKTQIHGLNLLEAHHHTGLGDGHWPHTPFFWGYMNVLSDRFKGWITFFFEDASHSNYQCEWSHLYVKWLDNLNWRRQDRFLPHTISSIAVIGLHNFGSAAPIFDTIGPLWNSHSNHQCERSHLNVKWHDNLNWRRYDRFLPQTISCITV